MDNLKNKFENTRGKVVGKTKETVGKVTGSEETELKGKLQFQTADLKDKFDNTKEKIAGKINNALDKNESDKVK